MKSKETQGQEQFGTNAKETDKQNSSKEGILKSQSGDETITDISENKELLTREKVENSPIELVGNEELGYWIGITNFRLTEPVKEKQLVKDRIEFTDWEAILNLYGALKIMEEMEKLKQQEQVKPIENLTSEG